MNQLLEISDYCCSFSVGRKRIIAVSNLSLQISRGEIYGLAGESGSGKSTLCRCIAGIQKIDGGKMCFYGKKRGIQLVFQNPFSALDPRMKLGKSLEEPLLFNRFGTAAVRKQRVAELIREVGLEQALLDRFPDQCSGGQLQRVCIARAFATEPDLLIADEPFSALDAATQLQIALLLKQFQKKGGSILLVGHDLTLLRGLCSRIGVMYQGKLVEQAETTELFGAPKHPYTQKLLSAIPDFLDLEKAAF